ncbi:hypothetical protein AGLY_013908 [Aphis glycines]|uniref:Uncharacterized protein n=1 Tax=Aphis glycines TaxID=307491 RepID=A0A6G0T580_APHGL|nr:hypothetical protein AGLY_013908 [Aphis glycines]
MVGSITNNAALYKKKTFIYIPPTPPAELIDSTNYTLNFAGCKFVNIGLDPANEFNTAVHIITPSRNVNISPEFLRRIFALMGNLLAFILEQPLKYKKTLFLDTSINKLSKCKLTKKVVTLDLDQWCKLMCENNFNTIIENLHTRCKRVKIADNFFYSVNVNQSTIVLYSNDNYITLSHIDLHRMKQLQHCIDLYIVEKQKKLESYQKTFDTAYALINYSNIQSEDCSFMYELLQFHFNSFSNMILQDLVM